VTQDAQVIEMGTVQSSGATVHGMSDNPCMSLQVPETVDEEPDSVPPQTKQEGKFF